MLNLNFFKKQFLLKSFVSNIPHPEKIKFGGEDSYFISKNNNTIGIADGVGGWANIPGGNSAKYSKDLMNYCNEFSNLEDPLKILELAFNKMDKNILGSTTVMILKLIEDNCKIINIGDSGCLILRNNKILFQTKPTLYGFNFPFQLGKNSKTLTKDGTINYLKLLPNDIILTATDGIWDNIFKNDILNIINNSLNNFKNDFDLIKSISFNLSNLAFKNSNNKNFISPFALEAKENGFNYIGGKSDDITLITSLVK